MNPLLKGKCYKTRNCFAVLEISYVICYFYKVVFVGIVSIEVFN